MPAMVTIVKTTSQTGTINPKCGQNHGLAGKSHKLPEIDYNCLNFLFENLSYYLKH